MADDTTKFLSDESRIPTHWVNLVADLPGDPLPPLSPATFQPAGPADLSAIFPEGLILQFARTEGIIPAPESAHAIRAAIDEALAAEGIRRGEVILFGLSGHGHFDLAAYDAYLAGTLEDPEFSAADADAATAKLPAGTPVIA